MDSITLDKDFADLALLNVETAVDLKTETVIHAS
jgi:hypothetical protein